jgi:hypothetical protein
MLLPNISQVRVVYDNVCDLRIQEVPAIYYVQPDLITTQKVKYILSGSDTDADA